MQRLIGNKGEIFFADAMTEVVFSYDEIGEITDKDIISEDDETNEMIKRLSQDKSFSCEIELVPEVSNSSEKKKPNPIYVPKHIAKRRKW